MSSLAVYLSITCPLALLIVQSFPLFELISPGFSVFNNSENYCQAFCRRSLSGNLSDVFTVRLELCVLGR